MYRQQCARNVQKVLEARYPTPRTHLHADNPWQLLVAVVLSAQCTDARVNMVTPELFHRWPDAAALAQAELTEVEEVIRSTGFYHNKAKNIIAAARRVMDVYNGALPQSLEELTTLAGVARKTANVVMWGAFGRNEGIAVDTHVGRIAYRLGLTASQDPLVVEQELMQLFPQEEWGRINHRLVWFGRHRCMARNPDCEHCEMAGFCPRIPWQSVKTAARAAKKAKQ